MAAHKSGTPTFKSKFRQKKTPSIPPVKIRVKFIDGLPERVQKILQSYMETSQGVTSFEVPALPMSVNQQYIHSRTSTRLREEVLQFRNLFFYSMGAHRNTWKPKGISAAVLVFQSPNWITLDHTIKENDLDNRIKPTLDAINTASAHSDDRQFWDVISFKMLGKTNKTYVFLFDLGDVVDCRTT